jgi:hypothetical protein
LQYTPIGGSHRHQLHVEIAGKPYRSVEIVVQGDDRVAESLAKMIYYANHAQRYAADPKAREDVKDVLARQGVDGGAERFGKCLCGRHLGLAAIRLS